MKLDDYFINSAQELLGTNQKFFTLLSLVSNWDDEGLDNLISKIVTNYFEYNNLQTPISARSFYTNQQKLIRAINNNARLKDYLRLHLT